MTSSECTTQQAASLLKVPAAEPLDILLNFAFEHILERLFCYKRVQVTADPPAPVADTISFCKAQKAEWNLPEVEIVKVRASAGSDRLWEQMVSISLAELCVSVHNLWLGSDAVDAVSAGDCCGI